MLTPGKLVAVIALVVLLTAAVIALILGGMGFSFAEKPVENVTLQAGTTQAFLYVETGEHGVNGTNSSARYNVFRPGAYSNSATFYLSFHVIGKWK